MKIKITLLTSFLLVFSLARSATIPVGSFPVVTSPLDSMQFFLNYTNGGLSPNPLLASNGLVPYASLKASISNYYSPYVNKQVDTSSNILANLSGGFNIIIPTNYTTTQIQTALNSMTSGGVVTIQPGLYTITAPIVITNPMTILGNNATWKYQDGLTNAMVTTTTNYQKTLSVYNLRFDGGTYIDYNDVTYFNGTVTPGQHFPFLNVYWTNRTGLRVEASKGVHIEGCTFYGWSGQGCIATSLGGTSSAQGQPKFEFVFNRCYTNFIGVYATVASYDVPGYYNSDSSHWLLNCAPEYSLIEGNDIFHCQYGAIISAGNALVQGNTINENYLGLSAYSGPNAQHGRYCGNTMNHNHDAIYFEGGGLGGMFQDNACLANTAITFNGVTAVVFKNNNISQSGLYFTNGTVGEILNNTYEYSAIWGDTNVLTGITTNINAGVTVSGNISTDGTNIDGTAISILQRTIGSASSWSYPITINGTNSEWLPIGAGVTNVPPTSVTIGTTAADKWMKVYDTNGVLQGYTPVWTNH